MNTREHRQTLVHQDLDEQIRKQAYYLWQQNGCREGHELDHWLEAKEIVRHRQIEPVRVRLHHRERVPVNRVMETV
jgi:Protein of unknown function (DUF2934)